MTVSQFSSAFGGGGGTESGKPVKKLGGLPSSTPPVYVPPAGAGGADTGNSPGTYQIEPFNPGGTAENFYQESESGLAGLKNALFGTSAEDINGQHGGILGDLPGVGAGLRAASEAVSNVGQAAGGLVSGVAAGIGGGLEHVDLGSDEQHREVQSQFDSLPDSPAKVEALAAIARDPGATGHYMAKAIRAYDEENLKEGKMAGKPEFTTGAFRTAGSAAEAFDNILGAIGLTARAGERTWATLGTPGQEGMNRLDLIMAVGDHQLQFNEDRGVLGTGLLAGEKTEGGLNNIEQIVYAKRKSNEWTPDEAMDFLAANNAGFSHSAIANIAGNLALDPSNLVGLGAAGIGKLGLTGEKLAAAAYKADEAVNAAEAALRVARTGGKGDEIAAAAKALMEAQDEAQVIKSGALKVGGDVSKLNVLGHAARSEKATNIVRGVYATYEPLQKLHVDKALKVGRAFFDPLGAVSLHNPFRKQMVDLVSDDAIHSVIGAYGSGNHAGLVHKLADATDGASTPLADMFSEDMGTYGANLTRRVVAREQRRLAEASGNLKSLFKKDINAEVAGIESRPASFQEHILAEANTNRIHDWDDAALTNLSDRLADNYATKSAEDWKKWLVEEGLNPDQVGMLHAATYGRATKRLLAAVEEAKKLGAGDLTDKLHRIILINRTTLTKQGAAGIVADIQKIDDVQTQLEFIKHVQTQYPQLRHFSVDPGMPQRSVERFIKDIERITDALPAQVVDDELKQLPSDLKNLHSDKTYTLGFAPEDEYKWGLVRSNMEGGGWAPINDVWVDHVAPGLAMGYRTASQLVPTNVYGQPILGAAAKKLVRSIDYIDAGVKTMGRRVNGAIIAESARTKFLSRATAKYGKAGITKTVAEDIMKALEDAVQMQDLVVRPSGFSTKQMWKAAEDVIPKHIRPADFNQHDLMELVLHAYQGDMRYVGLTQAFSSRVKRLFAFEGNNASMLAEQIYPFLKYRLNVVFQVQEKVEPWVLNSMRGVTPAKSARSLNDADKATHLLLQRMADRSLVSNAEHEMAEQAAGILYGKNVEQMAADTTSSLGRITKTLGVDWSAIRDVKGVKQVNMLRTFRKGMGADLRKSWDAVDPGRFDDMYAEAVRKSKRGVGGLDEDEFAVSILAEQMLGNNVFVGTSLENRLNKLAGRFDKVDYKAAIAPGAWHAPATLGEMKTLDLDSMAELLAFPVGRGGALTRTEGDIRAAIAAGKLTTDDVVSALNRLNADPDYVRRVESALTFSYTGFWDQVAHDFKLSKERTAFYQNVLANAAELRGMKPAEYLSQILIPVIGEGKSDAVVGHLGQIMDVMSGGKVIDTRPSLGGLNVMADAAGDEAAFVRQLASVFTAHLDPSAKKALIRQFQPTLHDDILNRYDVAVEDINRIWTPEMDEQLSKYILGEINRPTDIEAAYEAGQLKTIADFDRIDPGVEQFLIRSDGVEIPTPVYKMLGDGLRAAPPEVQRDVLGVVGRMQAEFPDIQIRHVDIHDDMSLFAEPGEDVSDVAGITVESSLGGDAIILNSKFYGDRADGTKYADIWAHNADSADKYERYKPTFTKQTPFGPQESPRESTFGATFSALNAGRDTVAHEVGHVIDTKAMLRWSELNKKGLLRTKEGRMYQRYNKFRDQFQTSLGGRRLSEYAQTNYDEAMAELHSLAFSAKTDDEVRAAARAIDAATEQGAEGLKRGRTVDPVPAINEVDDLNMYYDYVKTQLPGYDMSDWEMHAREWEMMLEDGDVDGAADALKSLQKETKRITKEIEAENRDIIAGHKADLRELGKGPQTVEDAAMQMRQIAKDMGLWKPAPVREAGQVAEDPDVVRAVQMFGRWSNAVMGEHIRKGENAVHAATMEKISGIPTHQAVPYNYTEHMLMDTALQSMTDKWHDAYRLQYYSKSRTMMERSINHPMFGIYPASYMWGKILPELVQFMAQRPFGVRTGAAAYSYMDVQRAVAMQREFDPELDKNIETMGHSASMYALGYMLPSWPWEASAAWPAWAREFSQEGLDMQARVESGGTVASDSSSQGINLPQIAGKAADTANPLKAFDRAFTQPLEEVHPPKPEEDVANRPYFSDAEPVPATELGDPLQEAMSSLRELLGG